MRRRSFFEAIGLAAFAVTGTAHARTRPGEACGRMLMPVAQLKQVSRGFGPMGRGFHSGLDLTAPYGSPVRAAADGVVGFVGSYFGYGRMIDLRHPDGTVTRYAHLSAYAPALRIGTAVAAGDSIGAVGTSGHAHGSHLHFEVRPSDRAVDPKPFLGLACTDAAPPAQAPVVAVADDRPRTGGH